MAKIIGPLHSTEARGVIGGLIFNTWRGTRYVKRMTSPAQPRTQLQLNSRAITIRLVRAWQNLSSTNRGLWDDYAASHPVIDWTGVAKRLTGANWFVGLNYRLLSFGAVQEDTPPIVAAPDAVEAFAANTGILQSILTWTVMAGTNLFCEIWKFGPHSAGLNAKIEQCRFEVFANGEAGTATIADLRPGTYTFFARTLSEDDGQVSPWVSDTAVITAA